MRVGTGVFEPLSLSLRGPSLFLPCCEFGMPHERLSPLAARVRKLSLNNESVRESEGKGGGGGEEDALLVDLTVADPL